MTVVCAWCRVVIDQDDPAEGITHGICLECYDRQVEHLTAQVQDRPELADDELWVTLGGESGGA